MRLDATGVPTEPGRLTANPANDTAASWRASLPEAGDRPLTYPLVVIVVQRKVVVYAASSGTHIYVTTSNNPLMLPIT